MSSRSDKLAPFIDGANLYATVKALGFDIDYKRLLREFQGWGTMVRAYYYTAIIEDQEYSSIRPLIDWLDYNGYTVATKTTKEFIDATGRRRDPTCATQDIRDLGYAALERIDAHQFSRGGDERWNVDQHICAARIARAIDWSV
jgi:uncharacterized LabA/DUF88 family protein